MLKVDHTTSIHSRGKFARICVEIDLSKQLVPSIQVLGRDFKIKYDGLHLIYFGCGSYGHRMDQCSKKQKKEVQLATDSTLLGDPVLDGMELESAKKGKTSGHNSSLNKYQADFREPNPVNEGNSKGVVNHEDPSSRFEVLAQEQPETNSPLANQKSKAHYGMQKALQVTLTSLLL
ncbi:hypothetical protein Ahy_B05g074486 [Arachis hypogaea]|uniref:Zinc knuckle CX2CX4HX4C domain-containing protein n=1 Tax=Arachis hypogaea TaxID=3818 RepID=A0A444YZ17_ARAHY|nr:hypothetical protein Ahy_B05g074486 [Arachis hypogaea]